MDVKMLKKQEELKRAQREIEGKNNNKMAGNRPPTQQGWLEGSPKCPHQWRTVECL
jgi:hypothetical protein